MRLLLNTYRKFLLIIPMYKVKVSTKGRLGQNTQNSACLNNVIFLIVLVKIKDTPVPIGFILKSRVLP